VTKHNFTFQASAKANQLTVLICDGRSSTPKSRNITLSLNVEFCGKCKCFTVPAGETRDEY